MLTLQKGVLLTFLLASSMLIFPAFFPHSNMRYFYIGLTILLLTLIAYPILLIYFGKRRRENAPRLIALINMIVFCLFFAFPLFKVFANHHWVQLISLIIFCLFIPLAIYDQRGNAPLILPERNDEQSKFGLAVALGILILSILGGGGNIIIVRQMYLTFGDKIMSVYGSIILYLLGCYLVFIFSSIYYKFLFKEGLWIRRKKVKRKKTSLKKKVPSRS